nr:DUF3987 domain-containing protein [uncultured Arsenicibacter sp.]
MKPSAFELKPVADVLGRIRSQTYASRTQAIRATADRKARKRQKTNSLAAVCFGCHYQGSRLASNVVSPSGLLYLDFSEVPDLIRPALIEGLKADKSVYASWVSAGGKGVKVLCRIAISAKEEYPAFHGQMADYYRGAFKVEASDFTKDITALCYVSHDAKLHINNDAVTLPLLPDYRPLITEKQAIKESEKPIISEEQQCPSDEWPEPLPIKTSLLPVRSIEPDMLPEAVRGWLLDIAGRMKCPLDYVAAAFVVSVSSLVGTRLAIKPKAKDDWTIVPNLWGAVIGDPSMMKSPSVAEVLKPLNQLVAEAQKEFDAALHAFEAQKLTFEAQKKAFQAQETDRLKGKPVSNPVEFPEQPAKPVQRRYMTNDATIEKQGELLNENPNGLLQHRDELIGLLSSWDKSGHEQDRAFYLEAWNGSAGFTIDRIGRGTMHIKSLCLSLFGGIQPAKLIGYLQAATGYENDGFVQRLQVAVYPDKPQWAYTDEQPDKAARARAYDLIKRIAEADLSQLGYVEEYGRFAYTRFDAEAQEAFKQWLIRLETQTLPAETGLMMEHLTKYRSLMPSLALVFHVTNAVDSGSNEKHVSSEATQMAVKWCDYLTSHARRIYGLLDTAPVEGASRILREIKAGNLKDGFKVREIVRNGWSHLNTTSLAEAALSILMNSHYVRPEEQPETGGRPEADRYRVNPLFMQNA